MVAGKLITKEVLKIFYFPVILCIVVISGKLASKNVSGNVYFLFFIICFPEIIEEDILSNSPVT